MDLIGASCGDLPSGLGDFLCLSVRIASRLSCYSFCMREKVVGIYVFIPSNSSLDEPPDALEIKAHHMSEGQHFRCLFQDAFGPTKYSVITGRLLGDVFAGLRRWKIPGWSRFWMLPSLYLQRVGGPRTACVDTGEGEWLWTPHVGRRRAT